MARPTKTRRRAPLSRERVLRAALTLADEGGGEALSMRSLGKKLGVEAMSLYNHVANREDIVDGLVDIVFSEIAVPAPGETDWKAAMRRRAISTREVLNRHRWAVGLMESRRTPGPDSIRAHNAILGYLREGGFSVEATVQAYSVLDAYIYGFALQEKSVPFEDAEESAALAEEQARQFEADEQTAALADEYPYLAEVVAGHVAKVGYDFGTAFEHGLDLILDALEQRRDEPGSAAAVELRRDGAHV